MSEVTVVIPNWNGMRFLPDCLASLEAQTFRDFRVILIDNGSTDGSCDYVRSAFPKVRIRRFHQNTGFCRAVNEGIRMSRSPYVLLLNNDTVLEEGAVGALLSGIKRHPGAFSCQAKLVRADDPQVLDDAGDFYCALGWAFPRGRGMPAGSFDREEEIFSACAAAAIYRREALEKTGLFDEAHFAYLEDVDIGWRARTMGYTNWFVPDAVVRHVGSGSSGSVHNAFKVEHSARNSVLLIKKNMPAAQVILNAPLLAAGFVIKAVYFARKGLGKEYIKGLAAGLGLSAEPRRPGRRDAGHCARIQLELWRSLVRRLQVKNLD